MITLFLSNQEVKNIKGFLENTAEEYFDFSGVGSNGHSGRYYVDVIKTDNMVVINEDKDAVRIVGLGMFYIEDEDY